MKKAIGLGLLAVLLLLTGCSGKPEGTPRAVVPETEWDFGDVPVTDDMRNAEVKIFVIRNEGTAPLKLLDGDIKVLEGC